MIAIRTLIFTFFVPGTVTVLIPYLLYTSGMERLDLPLGVLRLLGWPIVLLGVAIYAWCAWDFTFTGKGTPLPADAPKVLVVRGLYRYVRNPMYVGVLSVIVGEALLLKSGLLLIYAALLWVLFHIFVVSYEEPTLSRLFGDSYAEYRRKVHRWLPSKPSEAA